MEDLILVYEDQVDQKKIHTPEQRLQYGVLMSAIQDLQSQIVELQTDAYRWLHSNAKDHPFAFVICCESFDLDPGSVRSELGKYRLRWDHYTLTYSRIP